MGHRLSLSYACQQFFRALKNDSSGNVGNFRIEHRHRKIIMVQSPSIRIDLTRLSCICAELTETSSSIIRKMVPGCSPDEVLNGCEKPQGNPDQCFQTIARRVGNTFETPEVSSISPLESFGYRCSKGSSELSTSRDIVVC